MRHTHSQTATDREREREREREIQAERVDEQFCITKQFVVAHKWFGHSANAGAVASPNALCSSNDVSTCPNEDRIYSDIIVVHGYIFNWIHGTGQSTSAPRTTVVAEALHFLFLPPGTWNTTSLIFRHCCRRLKTHELYTHENNLRANWTKLMYKYKCRLFCGSGRDRTR